MPAADSAAGLRDRPATPADVNAIARIHTAARSAYYRGFVAEDRLADPAAEQRRREIYARRLADPRYTVLCAEAGPEVTGFTILGPPHEPAPGPAVTGQLGPGLYARHGWRPDGHRHEGPAGFDFLRLVLAITPG